MNLERRSDIAKKDMQEIERTHTSKGKPWKAQAVLFLDETHHGKF